MPTPDPEQACSVPLIELLDSVPFHCREFVEIEPHHHRNIPYGRLCQEAAEEIRALRAEVERLTKERDEIMQDQKDGAAEYLSNLETITTERDALTEEVALLRRDKEAMDWIESHVEYIVLRANTLPLEFREQWDSRPCNRRDQIYAAMQPASAPIAGKSK